MVYKKHVSIDDYVQGVLSADRAMMARAITLMESSSPKSRETAQEVLRLLLPKTGHSFRIGITGVPGAGKSTFIEALGCLLTGSGYRVAVLAVDPSSVRSRGSILGDKIRMSRLSREENAFIRPSPSGGALGGVARKTRETLLVCEAAGFDVILIETVGVGQSEIDVRSMTDFFFLLLLPSSGDEMQGIKRGIMEWIDLAAVNKADGEWAEQAQVVAGEYSRALSYLLGAIGGRYTQVLSCSARTGEGVPAIWELMDLFRCRTKESGLFFRRRQEQALHWMHSLLKDHLQDRFYGHPAIRNSLPVVERALEEGAITPVQGAERLLRLFQG